MKLRIQDALALSYDIIMSPETTMKTIVDTPYLKEGLLVWAFTLLLPCISASVQMKRFSPELLAGTILGACLLLLVQIVCIHGTAGLFGGEGPIKGLAAGLCYADIPLCFGTLLESLVFIIPSSLVHMATFLVAVWSLWLSLQAVKINYGLGNGRSLVALFLPVILFACIFMVLAVYFVFSIMSLVKGF